MPDVARLRAILSNGGARDVLVAYEGMKAARVAVPAACVKDVIDLLRGIGMAVALSAELTYTLKDRGKGGWSNQFSPKRNDNPHRVIYAAKSVSISEEAARAEALGDAARLGRMLAIPECCRDFYGRHADNAARDQGDLLPFSAPLTWQRVRPLLNLGTQYFDMGFISHFPCSCGCAASERFAEEQARVLQHYDPAWARDTRECLLRVCVYTEEDGVFLLRRLSQQRHGFTYANDDILGTSLGPIHDMLVASSAMKLDPEGAIILGSEDGSMRQLTARNLRILVPALSSFSQ